MSHQRHSAKIDFAECLMSGTRQTLILPSVRFLPRAFCEALGKCKRCRVLDIMHSAKSLALGIRVVSGSGAFPCSWPMAALLIRAVPPNLGPDSIRKIYPQKKKIYCRPVESAALLGIDEASVMDQLIISGRFPAAGPWRHY